MFLNDNQYFYVYLYWGYYKFFIRTYQKAPIVQHYTYNTIRINNYIHISCTRIYKGERYITSTPNSGHHRFN